MVEVVDRVLLFSMVMQLHFNASHKSIASPTRIHSSATLMAVAGSHFVTSDRQRGMSFVWANN